MEKLKRKVPIKNVLYMFSYVWDKAYFEEYVNLNNEDDFDSANILSTLFLINVNSILKRGLYKEYNEINEEIKGIRGKIDFKNSLNNLSFKNAKAFCNYDILNENNIINQIIKTTALKLYRANGITDENKKKLNNVLLYFNQVDLIEIKDSTFNIRYNKNNLYTKHLINVCELINNSLMLSEDKGSYKFINILDDDKTMQNIYEMFIYKFYKYHLEEKQKKYNVSYQTQLNWDLYNGNQEILPKMRLDILLKSAEETIIIDTKYYSNYLSKYMDGKGTLISGNMYQMYTYMNQINTDSNLTGMLLYPLNGEPIDETYDVKIMGQSEISDAKLRIKTIDLSKNWEEIEKDLMEMVLGAN
ncbi:MAG: hypothetical protein IJS47_03215 [Clostridia bacterium]|nr:hypothetical protein [Clostridia bacterium]